MFQIILFLRMCTLYKQEKVVGEMVPDKLLTILEAEVVGQQLVRDVERKKGAEGDGGGQEQKPDIRS